MNRWWVLVPVWLGCSWADLRPREVRRADVGELLEREARGRARLEAVAKAHGLAAYASHQTLTVEATDRWNGSGTLWPGDVQEFRADRVLGTFTSRVTLVGGKEDGEIWGIQDWRPYRGEPAVFQEDDPSVTFYLPTLQYLDELPFRLLTAEHVLDAGRSKSGHDRLFVTWADLPAHKDADHYVVYVDPETSRIDRVTYTIREAREFSPWVLRGAMKALAVGTIHLRDLREVDGVWLAFDQIITLGDGEKTRPPEERVFHRLEVHRARFDEVPVSRMQVDVERSLGGDIKR